MICQEMMAKCKGACCGAVPIENTIIQSHKALLDELGMYQTLPLTESSSVVLRGDRCAFLSNNQCTIYADRPKVCREYGTIPELPCAYLAPDGIPRTRSDRRRIQKAIDTNVNHTVKELKNGKRNFAL